MEKKEDTLYSPNFFDIDDELIDQEDLLYDYHEGMISLNDVAHEGHVAREERLPKSL